MRVFRASRGAPPTCGQVRGFLLPLSSQPPSARLSPAHAALSRPPPHLAQTRTRASAPSTRSPPLSWPHLGEEEVSVDVDGGEHEAHEQHDHAHRQVAHAAHGAPLPVAVGGGPLLLWTAVRGQPGGGPTPWEPSPPLSHGETSPCWPQGDLGTRRGKDGLRTHRAPPGRLARLSRPLPHTPHERRLRPAGVDVELPMPRAPH